MLLHLRTHWFLRFATTLLAATTLMACGDNDPARPSATGDPTWAPSMAFRSIAAANSRGLIDRRGLIHAHSIYSHDACDNMPVKDGVRDAVCFEDFRRDLCRSKHDFVMLTDHPSDFAQTEFPETLLYRPERGDRLVQRDGVAVASRAGCTDGSSALILAGAESMQVMPVGLQGHVSPDVATRTAVYGSTSAAAAATLREHGALVLLAHTENWTPAELMAREIDGFEMYNLHANLLLPQATRTAIRLLLRLDQHDPGLPHPDLALLPLISEDPRYLTTWGSVLASGKQLATTMGTDCHRNTFQALMQDGERVDSYRRLMMWFSNHLLLRPQADGSWDDRHLKAALKGGRLYGAFEILGYPEGFDFQARTGTAIAEMGEEMSLAEQPTFHVAAPSLRGLDPSRAAPRLQVRILRAIPGGFEEMASSPGDLSFAPTLPGAYRAEVRMTPLHLRDYMGVDAEQLLSKDYVWVYSNAIYIR